MKKLIVLAVLSAVIIAGIWFGMNKFSAKIDVPGDASSATTTSSDLEDDSLSDAQQAKDAALESAALKIIDRPVVVKVQLSEATKKLALEKIKESADLIRANYDYANPWYDLGAYLKLIGDYDGAIQAWLFVGKIRPNDYVSLSNLGDLHAFTFGNYPEAENYFLASISKNPQNVDAYIQVAVIYEYHEISKLALMEPLLLRGISANPKDTNLKIALARYYQKAGNLESARLYFEKALELNPENSALEEELKSLGK